MEKPGLKKELSLLLATALVAGNMMGSGIFMLPATLAKNSSPGTALLSWVIAGIGSILLALSFAKLGSRIPATGGPYAFAKKAFGEPAGFMNAWLYWNGSWIGNAAVIIAVASYLSHFFPIIQDNRLVAFLVTSGILWFFTIVNILGVKRAGLLQTTITILELSLFVFFILVCAMHFNPGLIGPIFPEKHGISTLPTAMSSIMWAFIGLESATIAAGEIRNPERNVAKATIMGIGIATVFYLIINLLAMGNMSQANLAGSSSPLADILNQYLGSAGSNLITSLAIISVLGTTVGWLLATARAPFTAAEDGVMPRIFAKVHPKFGTPYVSLIISGILCNIMLITNYVSSLANAFNFVMLLATLAFLPVYASTAVAEIVLMSKREKAFSLTAFLKASIAPLLGFAYAVWCMMSTGSQTVAYGFLLILLGVPVFIYYKMKDAVWVDSIRKTM